MSKNNMKPLSSKQQLLSTYRDNKAILLIKVLFNEVELHLCLPLLINHYLYLLYIYNMSNLSLNYESVNDRF